VLTAFGSPYHRRPNEHTINESDAAFRYAASIRKRSSMSASSFSSL
jgi:hypothetical protein